MKPEGRSGLVLPCTETGAHDTFGGIGVDVLLFERNRRHQKHHQMKRSLVSRLIGTKVLIHHHQ